MLDVQRIESERGLRLVGELDASNAERVTDAIGRLIDDGGDVTLDLADLRFMDSSGIRVLIRSAQDLDGKGRLILAHPADPIRRILDLVPVTKLENVEVVDGENRA